jgi:hypothetical protein
VAEPASEIVGCTIRGSQRLYPGTYVHATSLGGTILGQADGDVVGFELSNIAVGGHTLTRASVRAPANGPAFVLTGFIDVAQLEVFARRDLPIVPSHVWIEKGANVRFVRGGDGSRANVVSRYGAFDLVPAIATCDTLSLDTSVESEVPRAPRNASPERLAHFTHVRTPFYDENGAPLINLKVNGEATVELTEHRGDRFHVLYADGVAIDAWVSAEDLEPGAGPDCDDCHGSVRDLYDKCPDEPLDDTDGCPASSTIVHASALRDTDVRIGPEANSLVVGHLERRAEVVIINDPKKEPPKGIVRVRPRHGELEPVSGDYFVDESALARE